MKNTVKNAGKYNKRIVIKQETISKDAAGFPTVTTAQILATYAEVKTTKGFTLLVNNTDFEKALTNFTIRYPVTVITRDMFIEFNGDRYEIQYLNNINEANIELEIQAKKVKH